MPEIHLNGPIGRLEARYTHNNEANSPSVLILHAHPGHGGNMNNPLSLQLHKFFSDLGFSSLRLISEELENQMESMMVAKVNLLILQSL